MGEQAPNEQAPKWSREQQAALNAAVKSQKKRAATFEALDNWPIGERVTKAAVARCAGVTTAFFYDHDDILEAIELKQKGQSRPTTDESDLLVEENNDQSMEPADTETATLHILRRKVQQQNAEIQRLQQDLRIADGKLAAMTARAMSTLMHPAERQPVSIALSTPPGDDGTQHSAVEGENWRRGALTEVRQRLDDGSTLITTIFWEEGAEGGSTVAARVIRSDNRISLLDPAQIRIGLSVLIPGVLLRDK